MTLPSAAEPPSTPYLAVDHDRLTRNIATMATTASRDGFVLQPHAKTHKCVDIARMQRAAGSGGLTVATVSEAEVFAAAGFTELFLAYPLWVDTARGRRLRALLEDAYLTLGVDSAESARSLAGQLGEDRTSIQVLVEVDSGHHRSGIPAADAGEVAEHAAGAGLDVRGVFTFPGHGYAPGRRQDVASEEVDALNRAAASLRAHGITPEVVSGGSTPTVEHTPAGSVTHLRPGVYVFNDAQQVELESCSFDDVALTAVATVVSRAPGRVVLDSGSKVIGADRPSWTTGHGRLLDHPDARIGLLSEHHAVVTWPEHTPLPSLGGTLRVVPNHVCNAVNLVDELVVVSNGDVVDRWPVSARGANT